ncbi:MAG: hypothetical protein AAGJ82_00295 [Bacteroidota bacterium]
MLERLREALLSEDRKTLSEIQDLLNSEPQLAELIDPIIEKHLLDLEQNFPNAYVRVVQKIIDQRLRDQQDELINIIYPRLGIMIKRYITDEMRVLAERVDKMRKSSFSFLKRKAPQTKEEALVELLPYQVQEVYVVSHESGLLLGSASAAETADKDMIAGMLTAIKVFVEDAFRRTDEQLRGIQYGSYEIIVQNFFNYYIALAIEGALSETDREELARRMLAFAAEELQGSLKEPDPTFYAHLQKELRKTFIRKKSPHDK